MIMDGNGKGGKSRRVENGSPQRKGDLKAAKAPNRATKCKHNVVYAHMNKSVCDKCTDKSDGKYHYAGKEAIKSSLPRKKARIGLDNTSLHASDFLKTKRVDCETRIKNCQSDGECQQDFQCPLTKILGMNTVVESVSQNSRDEKCEGADSSLIPGLGDDEAQLCLARLSRSSYGTYYTVSKRFRDLFKSGELYRTRRRLGISEQWVYLLNSGQSVWRAFSPRDGGKWRSLPQTPADSCFAMCDKESLTAGTQLLVKGREIHGHAIWGYDLITNNWFRAPQMITARCLYASASYGEYGFVAGGMDANGDELQKAERYDSTKRGWEPLPDMIKKRKMCSGFYMNGKFYVIGGTNSSEGPLACGEEYDPETKVWKLICNMLPGKGDTSQISVAPPLVAVVDNQLYSLDASQNQLNVYCRDTNTWKLLGEVPARADVSSGWGLAFKALDGELLLIGGQCAPVMAEGNAIYAWKPNASGGPLVWRFVTGSLGTFVFNCAVMSA